VSGRSSVAVIKAGERGRIHLYMQCAQLAPEVNKYEQNALRAAMKLNMICPQPLAACVGVWD